MVIKVLLQIRAKNLRVVSRKDWTFRGLELQKLNREVKRYEESFYFSFKCAFNS